MSQIHFAIPGDITQRTGGYLYNARVTEGLSALGHSVQHLSLPASFPFPSSAEREAAHTAFASVPKGDILLADGLALGAMDPKQIAKLSAPLIALVHHPLGLETGLDAHTSEALISNERAVLAHAQAVIVTSPHTSDILEREFGVPAVKITLAIPGFDAPQRSAPKAEIPLIVSVGILARRKGHDVLLDALARITDLPWTAEIIGKPHDPTVAAELQAQCSALKLDHRVTFKGEIGASALQSAYSRAHLFALATRYEGYGMVLSEAMQHGLPIVSCAVGAVPGTVGAAGRLTPPNDPGAFADALRTMLTDHNATRAASRAALDAAAALPSWHTTAALIATALKGVRA